MRPPPPLQLLNILGALLFAVFAYLQYNDLPSAENTYYKASRLDAILWLAFYALIAVLFVIILFKPIPRWLLLIAALACLVEMIRSGPGLWENLFGEKDPTIMGHSMSGDDPRVELSREFLGALIALGAVVLLWFERQRFGRRRGEHGQAADESE